MNQLVPFTKTAVTDQFTFEAAAYHASAEELLIEFTLKGPLHLIRFPDPSLVENRRDELWKHTCLEAFFCTDLNPSSPYFELNCSPNGDWNAYAFSSYRHGMRPSESLRVKLVHREGSEQDVVFRLRITGPEVSQARHLGVTAVVEFMDGSKSYFALKHAGPQADFHLKDSFTISL